jgi:Tol biopolymer transport system component
MLVVWGQSELDDHCSVWIVDPIQMVSEKVLDEIETCNFKVTNIGGLQYLVYRESPGKMVIYSIDAKDRQLRVHEEVKLNGIEIISSPQWDEEGNLYFSSTVEGVEQLFRVNRGSEIVEPFLKNNEGIASGPIISPDGQHLVYWSLDGPTNLVQNPYCVTGCFAGHYHVLDLESNRDIFLLSLIKQYDGDDLTTSHHENAHWSPTGNFLAFQISVRGAGGIIIFDASRSEVVAHLQPQNIGGSLEIVQWISDSELVYMADRHFSELGNSLIRPYSYSLGSKRSEELLPNLPAQTDNGNYIYFYDFNMTVNGTYIIGVIPTISSAKGEVVSLFIAEADLEQSESYTFYSEEELPHAALSTSPFTNPVWSNSGKWIIYYSEYPPPGGDKPYNLADLYIVSIVSEKATSFEGVTKIVEPSLNYVWIQSR